jgi:N6-L-threonylcarbamoyladenine synthase
MEQEPDPGSLAVQNPELARFCASLNWTLARTLCIKVKRAFQAGGEVRTLIVSGGVAANSMIRQHLFELARDLDIELMIPSPHLCTDNGAVIAYQGWVLLNKGYSHSLALDAVPRGRPIPWDYEGPVS